MRLVKVAYDNFNLGGSNGQNRGQTSMSEKEITLIEEFFGTEEQENPEYVKQLEAEFIQSFAGGLIQQM